MKPTDRQPTTSRTLALIRAWPQPPTSRLALRTRLRGRRAYPSAGARRRRAA